MSGRRDKAPCGHDGEYVIGTYVRCLTKGCDGQPKRTHFKQAVDQWDFSDLLGPAEVTEDLGLWLPIKPADTD